MDEALKPLTWSDNTFEGDDNLALVLYMLLCCSN